MFINASQKYRRCITNHLSEQSAIVTECSANIRLYRRCFGEHSPNHRKSIFFIGTAGIYAQNRKASGSIACIIIHFTIADAKIPNGTGALHWIHNTCTAHDTEMETLTNRKYRLHKYYLQLATTISAIHLAPINYVHLARGKVKSAERALSWSLQRPSPLQGKNQEFIILFPCRLFRDYLSVTSLLSATISPYILELVIHAL